MSREALRAHHTHLSDRPPPTNYVAQSRTVAELVTEDVNQKELYRMVLDDDENIVVTGKNYDPTKAVILE